MYSISFYWNDFKYIKHFHTYHHMRFYLENLLPYSASQIEVWYGIQLMWRIESNVYTCS